MVIRQYQNQNNYRPGEDDEKDMDIFPIFNFNQDNYIPSRAELMEEYNGSEHII